MILYLKARLIFGYTYDNLMLQIMGNNPYQSWPRDRRLWISICPTLQFHFSSFLYNIIPVWWVGANFRRNWKWITKNINKSVSIWYHCTITLGLLLLNKLLHWINLLNSIWRFLFCLFLLFIFTIPMNLVLITSL